MTATVATWGERVGSQLDRLLPGMVQRDVSIAELTTYRIGGPAAVLVGVESVAALQVVAGVIGSSGGAGADGARLLVIGRGSNLLVADEGFDGLAIVLGGDFDAVTADSGASVVVAGGSAALPVVARQAAAAGCTGLEFYVGIPGSVGGAVRMNAGGHGAETSEVLQRAWVLDLADGDSAQAEPRTVAQLDLSYRHSNLGPSTVVTSAEFRVGSDDPARCDERLGEVVRWRREHQPGGSNAGSVFRNPPADSAGRLIDEAGLKGFRVGGAVVSAKHANFFQAESGATASDVRSLVLEVQARVAASTGITLIPELQMVGFAPRRGNS